VDDIETTGRWRRPDEPGVSVAGTLTYSSQGIRLSTAEPMITPERTQRLESFTLGTVSWPVVHGETDGGQIVTLLDAESRYSPFGTHMTRAQAALLGDRPVHVDAFVEVRMSFDWLTAWLSPPQIYDRGEFGDDPEMRVDLARHVLARAPVDDNTLEFVAGSQWRMDRDSAHVDRATYVSLTLAEPTTCREILDRHVRPMQDFLVVAMGRPVQLTGLHLRTSESDQSSPDDSKFVADELFEVKVPLIQRDVQSASGYGELHAYPSPVLLDGASLLQHAPKIMAGWNAVNDRNRTAVIRLNAQAYARFNYLGNQCAAVAQAFESLFMRECGTKQKTKAEHAERVKLVHDALTTAGLRDDIVSWATNVLRARNDKSFPERFAAVIALSGQLGTMLLDALPDLAEQLSGLRHTVSHGSATEGRPSVDDDQMRRMYFLKELGTWVMRTALLELSGAPVAAVAVKNPRVTEAVHQLQLLGDQGRRQAART
jgi:hypothetical protein